MSRRLAHLLAYLTLLFAAFAPSTWAQDRYALVELDPSITVVLEGETADADVLVTEDGQHYLDATPILAALGNDVQFDATENVLTVRRSQDGVVMSLYTDTGLVQANGKDLGHLKEFGEVDGERLHLTPNALSVLSGLIPKFDANTATYELKLDPRLRVATGFDILVQDLPLIDVDPEPKAVGPVLLLPLLPIADALGHTVSIDMGSVTVRRAQDSAVFSLDLQTGVVSFRERPLGVVKDITYAQPDDLLLPSNAIETLTGTHIYVSGSQIEIVLDDRLGGAVAAGRAVDEVIGETPLTIESLNFAIGPQQLNRVGVDLRYKGISGRLRAEFPDLPTTTGELEPSWLSLDFATAGGVRGSVGDVYAERRELQGVGLQRIRGARAEKRTENGLLAVAVGQPATGSRQVSDDQSRLEFGGMALGARYLDEDGWEAGLSVRDDALTDDQRAVLTAISKRHEITPRLTASARANVGAFNGPARESAVDVRVSAGAQIRAFDAVDVTGFMTYDGVEFLRADLSDEALERDIADVDGLANDTQVPDIREESLDRISYGTQLRVSSDELGPLRNASAAIGIERESTGVRVSGGHDLTTYNASVGAGLGETGVSVTAGIRGYDLSGPVADTGRTISVGAYKTFDWASFRASYADSRTDLGNDRRLGTFTATAAEKTFSLPKAASVSVAPSATVTYLDGDVFARGGVIANFQSGEWFGRKNRFGASFGVVQTLQPNGSTQTNEFLTVSAGRQLPIGENMALGMAFNTDLDGNNRVGLTLKGRYDFARKQRLARTKKDTGMLTGQVFVDANRDGIRQEDERVIPGIVISLQNTRFALRADGNGAFSIQNLPTGIYDVKVATDRLPLGYALSEDSSTRVSIADGRITDIPLAVVRRGQIRGFVFEDENGNGTYDRGETRPEGKRITLVGEGIDTTMRTAAFGQFAFDDLPTASYDLKVGEGGAISIDLADAADGLETVRVPLPVTRLADSDPPPKNTSEPEPT